MNNHLKNLFTKQYTGYVFILALVCLGLSFFYYKNVFTYATFIFLFTVFDVVGYGNMIGIYGRWDDQTIIAPYRIMQNMFMVMTFIVVYFYAGLWSLLACMFGWWSGGCDLLYYLTLREPMKDEDYFWMRSWSIWLLLTPIKKMFGIEEYISKAEFILICSFGLIAGGVLSWVI